MSLCEIRLVENTVWQSKFEAVSDRLEVHVQVRDMTCQEESGGDMWHGRWAEVC